MSQFWKNGKKLLALASLAGVSLTALNSQAGSVYLQAGSGMPFLGSGGHDWDDVQNSSGFKVHDGRMIERKPGSEATWVIPVPVDSTTTTTWYLRHAAFGNGTNYTKSRICSFSKTGSFYSCSTQLSSHDHTIDGTGDVVGVSVPANGSAFTQHFMYTQVGSGNNAAILSHVRAYY
jgi:hypothetical protein